MSDFPRAAREWATRLRPAETGRYAIHPRRNGDLSTERRAEAALNRGVRHEPMPMSREDIEAIASAVAPAVARAVAERVLGLVDERETGSTKTPIS
jgi:hypothetical protein